MNTNEVLMKKCIKLAEKGKGYVSPNPLVGCIIVKEGKIIGKGYHKMFGKEHAEINAGIDAKKQGYNLKDSTVYVNLEPCSHTGKTFPCTDFLINEKVGKVVIGMKDPYEKVNGRGIIKLKKAGIDVKSGVLENECRELNRFFVKYVTRHIPYVTLKVAQSIDGKIALGDYSSKWITGEASRKFVHKLRSEYDVVLIGRNTAKIDNPSLTVREVRGRSPYRIVIDRNSTLPENLKLFSDYHKEKTYSISGISKKALTNIYSKNIIKVNEKDQKIVLKDILRKLYSMNISSILVEGGANLFSQFIKTGLYDDIYFFIAPKIIGKGISSFNNFEIKKIRDSKYFEFVNYKLIEKDLLLYCRNVHGNN